MSLSMKIACPFCEEEDNFYGWECNKCKKRLVGESYFKGVIKKYTTILASIEDSEYLAINREMLSKLVKTQNVDEAFEKFLELQKSLASIWFKQLKSVLISHSFLQIKDPQLRRELQHINNAKPLDIHPGFKHPSHHLTHDDLDVISDVINEFSIFNDEVEVGTLIVELPTPIHLSSYIFELRNAYKFQLYTASIIICRAILEICIKDIITQRGILTFGEINKDRLTLSVLLKECHQKGIISRRIREMISELCNFGNLLLHRAENKKEHRRKEAISTIRKTFAIIQDLYSNDV
ncbi:MAG: DUF4145 domain-containing protein [Deltaproteobacteria bacterium]